MEPLIRVKITERGSKPGINLAYIDQAPSYQAIWGRCQFTFDPLDENYDWLVVLDDIARIVPYRVETLRCPRERTILVTTEPSSISYYGQAFAAQFGYVITNHDAKTLPHSNAFRSQTGNRWFYGRPYDVIIKETKPYKTKKISTVCSDKQQGHTMHRLRYAFTKKMEESIVELERFGKGFKWIERKADALDPYEFHVAIENHIGKDVWTEKLADAFLGWCIPIYCGCPNVYDYFPKESVIAIDIHDMEGSIAKIKEIIAIEGEYERRFEALKEARRRVVEEYNLLAMIDQIVQNSKPSTLTLNQKIYSRRMMRLKSLPDLIRFIRFRINSFLKVI